MQKSVYAWIRRCLCCKGLLGDKRGLRVKSECLIVKTRLGGKE